MGLVFMGRWREVSDLVLRWEWIILLMVFVMDVSYVSLEMGEGGVWLL